MNVTISESDLKFSSSIFKDQVKNYQSRVEKVLDTILPLENESPNRLYAAMRYAVLGGGKRIRPLLVYFTGEMLSVDQHYLDSAAAAIEMIHVYSLIHDDLPAMDNDDLRRNKPTVHKAFDEAIAILAGDGLQALAFEVLANLTYPHEQIFQQPKAIALLAKAAGPKGMVAGQVLDMEGEGKQLNSSQIETMFLLKTGMLLRAAVMLPLYGDQKIDKNAIATLDHFAQSIGLAFQIWDDILDIEGQTEVLGKPQGSDLKKEKSSYPSSVGMEKAKLRVEELYQQAINSLAPFGKKANGLKFIANYIVKREF